MRQTPASSKLLPLHPFASLALLLLLFAGVPTLGQRAQAQQPSPADLVPGLPDGVEAWQVELDDLRLALVPLRLEELQAAADHWLDMVQEEVSRLSRMEIAIRRSTSEEEQSGLRAQLDRMRQRPIALVARLDAVLDELEQKGGDPSKARRYLTRVVAGVGLADARPTDADAPPAVEPWSLRIAELRNNLIPMRRSQLEREAETWLARVEDRVRLIADAENTAARVTGDERDAALRSAEELRLQRDAVIERTLIVFDALDRKGGDSANYRLYVDAVSGRPPIEITNVDEIRVRARAWLTSPQGGIAMGLKILQVLAILVVFWFLAKVAARAARTALKRMKRISGLLRDFVIGGVKKLVLLIGVIVAVATLGVNITPLVAALGAAGLVIGLALQGTLSNFASGLLILFYRPFDVGDVINAGGVAGKVEAMTLVSTVVITFDNQQMIVPNNAIWNGVITNVTGRATRRIDLTVGVDYRSDLDKVRRILEEMTRSHPKVLADPAPTIKLHEYADSSINFVVRPWASTSDYWDVYWDLQADIKKRFDAEGISIPFPQHDINFNGPVEIITRDA